MSIVRNGIGFNKHFDLFSVELVDHAKPKDQTKGKTEYQPMNIYVDLFLTFSRIGLFTFGGGLAMLPMLEKEVVNNKHWATYDELMDYYAIGQCTPGIIAVNTATFVGYSQKKAPGAIAATAGIVFPSLVIIMLIASLMTSFADQPIVQHALAGIRIAVCVLIAQAVVRMFKAGVKDVWGFGLFALFLVLSYFNILSATIVVVLAAIAGIVFKNIQAKNAPKPDVQTVDSVKGHHNSTNLHQKKVSADPCENATDGTKKTSEIHLADAQESASTRTAASSVSVEENSEEVHHG